MRVKYFVISHNRPESPATMAKYLNGINVTWVLGNDDEKAYKEHGAQDCVTGYKLIDARNYALNAAFEEGCACVQISDDLPAEHGIKIFEQEHFDKSKKPNMGGINHEQLHVAQTKTVAMVVDVMLSELEKTPYKLAGILPTTCPMSARPVVKNKAFVLGDFFVCLPSAPVFDGKLTLKEDYDFSLAHIKEYGGNVRIDNILFNWRHKAAGGVSDVRNIAEEAKNIAYLKEKWGTDVIKDSKTRMGEIRLNIKALT